MSLKMKLTSAIIMFVLIVATLVIGVIAAESQTIKLYGNVTFNVNDTSLFVKSVSIRQSETDDYVPLDDFLPGYVDENMNINLGPHEISYSSFSLRFDVINRTAETYVAGGVTLPSSLSSQVSASASGTINPTTKPLGSNDMADISITDDPDGQIIVTVTSTIAQTINLEGITVSIILQPEVLEGYTFSGNTLTKYTGSETEITIPSSYSILNGEYVEGDDYQVTTIDTTGFTNRANITSITLPSTVTNIGSGLSFDNWTSLSAINVASGNTTYSSENGVLYNADKTTLIRYPEGKTDSTYQIPTTVATIGASSFDSTKITSISIPSNVIIVGDYAFNNAPLSLVNIEDGVAGSYELNLGVGAFKRSSSVETGELRLNARILTNSNSDYLGGLLDTFISSATDKITYVDNFYMAFGTGIDSTDTLYYIGLVAIECQDHYGMINKPIVAVRDLAFLNMAEQLSKSGDEGESTLRHYFGGGVYPDEIWLPRYVYKDGVQTDIRDTSMFANFFNVEWSLGGGGTDSQDGWQYIRLVVR